MLAVVENDVKGSPICPTYQNRRQGQKFATFTVCQSIPLEFSNAEQVLKQRCCRRVMWLRKEKPMQMKDDM